jgi:hypothetical protein
MAFASVGGEIKMTKMSFTDWDVLSLLLTSTEAILIYSTAAYTIVPRSGSLAGFSVDRCWLSPSEIT